MTLSYAEAMRKRQSAKQQEPSNTTTSPHSSANSGKSLVRKPPGDSNSNNSAWSTKGGQRMSPLAPAWGGASTTVSKTTTAQHVNPLRKPATANKPAQQKSAPSSSEKFSKQESKNSWTTIASSNGIKKQPIAILSKQSKTAGPAKAASPTGTLAAPKATIVKNKPSKKPKPTLRTMSINDLISPPKKKGGKGIAGGASNLKSPPKPKTSTNLQVNSITDFPALSVASPSIKQQSQKKFAPPAKASVKIQQRVQEEPLPTNNSKQAKKNKASQAKKKHVGKKPNEPSVASMFFKPQEPDNRVGDGDEHKLLRLMQERTVYQKKGRQRLKPRKKKLTALKKKVLQERLKKWRELHPEDDPNTATGANSSKAETMLNKETPSICLYNYTSREDLEDDDEYEEIVENLKEMATKIGEVCEVFIPQRLDRDKGYPAFVRFKTLGDAAAAKACWNDLVVGGASLRVICLDEASVDDTVAVSWSEKMLVAESNQGKKVVPGTSVDEPRQVIIENVLTEDDYNDEDCMEESLDYLRQQAEKFGFVSTVSACNGQDGNVEVVCGNLKFAQDIADGLCTTVISGSQLSAFVRPITQTMEEESDNDLFSTILLENFLTEDDLEDEDCLDETLNDVRELAGKYGEITEVIADGSAVKISFQGGLGVAQKAVDELDGLCLGGIIVSAQILKNDDDSSMKDYIYLENLLTEDDLEDEDCLEESLGDIRQILSKFGEVLELNVIRKDNSGVVGVLYSGSKSGINNAMTNLNGMVIGGQIISAKMSVSDKAETSQENNNESSSQEDGSESGKRKSPENGNQASLKKPRTKDPEPIYSGDKLIPEYFAQCKRVPKIPNPEGPRKYAKIVNDERVRPLLSEMLGELMRLQKRAIEDKNAKARRRIVMGLREVARGIRAHKVKMVVMANNLDEYGAIDQKLQEIIDLAESEDVPLFFEFTKRSLGKAVGKSIKVAVVGIQNADGAHQPFKKLTAIASKF